MDAMELEAKNRGDHSWHACQVFLSPNNSTNLYLTVDFGTGNSTGIVSSEEEALALLRVRSIPLQTGQCLHVKEGEHVLALHKAGSKSLFFDAVVEKAWRVRHSNKTYCRCTFDIKFLHLELNGETFTVSSSSIRKLSTERISNHPTVAAFLNSWNQLNSAYPSCISLLEDTNSESDLHSLLEKQIEEISKCADASKNVNSEEILFGLQRVDLTQSSCNGKIVSSHIKSVNDHVLHKQNNVRRFTRSRSKPQIETKAQDEPSVKPTPIELLDRRPGLSPLAARAALAALRSELQKKPEMSDTHVEKRDLDPSSENSMKRISMVSLDLTGTRTNSEVFIEENVLVARKLESEEFLEHLEGSKSVVSNGRNGSSGPSRVLTSRKKPASVAINSKGKKLDGSNTITRVTRSTVNRTPSNSTIDVRQKMGESTRELIAENNALGEPLEGSKSTGSYGNEPSRMVAKRGKPATMESNGSDTIKTRVTRSKVNRTPYNSTIDVKQKNGEITEELIAENNELGEPLEGSKSTVSYRNEPSRMVAKREKPATVAMNLEGKKSNGSDTITARVTRSTVNRTPYNSTIDVKQKMGETAKELIAENNEIGEPLEGSKSNGSYGDEPSRLLAKREKLATVAMNSEGKKSNGSDTITRVTRSTVSRTDESTFEVEKNLEKRKSTQNTCTYSIEGNDKSVDVETKKRKLSSTFKAKRTETQEPEKRSKATVVTPTITKNQDTNSVNNEHRKVLKLNASGSKMPISRFSARLKFLPRTRSQKSS